VAVIPFSANHQDLSTARGHQFKFYCQKCNSGYMSTFRPNRVGTAASLAHAAAGLLGGIFGRAAYTADQVQQMTAGPQRDAALKAAIAEIQPHFRQCSRCGSWVCEKVCWNADAGLCETCAPDLSAEQNAAKAAVAREQAGVKARQAGTPAAAATCPSCGAQAQSGKFCGECGASLATKRTCGSCGTEVDGAPKFCPECGNRLVE
jgi:hypothetical protein